MKARSELDVKLAETSRSSAEAVRRKHVSTVEGSKDARVRVAYGSRKGHKTRAGGVSDVEWTETRGQCAKAVSGS